jgi:hypothetical protein
MRIIPTGGYKLNFLANQTAGYSDAEVRFLLIVTDRWSDGGWFPSLTRIAKQTGWDVRKVRRVRDGLVTKGAISYEAGDGRTNSDYTLHVVEDWWAARGDPPSAPCGGHPAVEGAVVSPPVSLPESNHLSKEQDRARRDERVRRLMRTVPDELLATVKALQQVPSKPGCDPERLIPHVLDAAGRCGCDAVKHLYHLVAGEKGGMPAWQLYKLLENLRPHSDRKPAECAPQPVAGTLFDEAKHLVERAHETIRGQLDVQSRIRAAGFAVQAGWWYDRRHWIAQGLARTLAAERGITP